MPWSAQHYPVSMKHLPPLVRDKAIDIANALLDEGHADGQAIRIAIARAREWADRHGLMNAPEEGPTWSARQRAPRLS